MLNIDSPMRQRLGSVLRTGYLRNILIASVCIAVVFPFADRFFIYPLFSEFVIENTQEEAVRAAKHLVLELSVGPQGVTKESIPSRFVHDVDMIMRTLGLMKFKVFSKSGEILFSSVPGEIGCINEKAYFHDIVAKGVIYTNLIRKDSKTSEEDQVATLDVVETYVPIPGDGEFAGAFEIYYDITGRMAKIDRLVFVSTIILVGVASGLLIVVFWTLSKAVSATMQRDLAEAALRESEERQADAIESLSDAFVLYDADGKLVLCNQKQHDFFPHLAGLYRPGGSWEEIKRRHAAAIHEKDPTFDVEGYLDERLKLINTPRPDREGRLIDGRWVAIRESALAGGGMVSIRTDITERKRAEEALIKAKMEAETANRAKSDFLSSMSHELRTPMNAILGFGQMLELSPKEPLAEIQKNYVGYILKAGQHLLELIKEILDLAKIEGGDVELSIEDVCAKTALDECLSLIHPMADERGIEIVVREGFKAAAEIRADPIRFKQSLLNLLSNAVKYNRENGKITLDCHETPGGMLHVSVTDTGEGIPEDMHGKLFGPFHRLGMETTNIKGTGIGLTITKHLIERMDGHIGVDSEIGKGSTFWIELPLAERIPIDGAVADRKTVDDGAELPPDVQHRSVRGGQPG